jgi:hypothetical protein
MVKPSQSSPRSRVLFLGLLWASVLCTLAAALYLGIHAIAPSSVQSKFETDGYWWGAIALGLWLATTGAFLRRRTAA